MKAALDAVRWLRSSVVQTGKNATAFEKRAFLRHFADIAEPVCQIRAQLRSVEVLPCSHAHCAWAFCQADWQISNETSSCELKVVRLREALTADGWIVVGQVLAEGTVLYLLNKKRLLHGQAPIPNLEPARRIHIPKVTRKAEVSR